MAQFPPPTPLTAAQDEEALRLMDSLDHWSDRCEGHHTPKRTRKRNMYRQRVTVYVPEGFMRFANRDVEYSFEAWARNLSPGGLALLYPGQLKFEQGIVCLNPDQEGKRCVHMNVNRIRRVSQGFWEYGLQFEKMVEDVQALLME